MWSQSLSFVTLSLGNCLQTLPLNLSISCPAARGKETTWLILPLLQAPLSFRGKYSERITLIFQPKYPCIYSFMFDPTPLPKILFWEAAMLTTIPPTHLFFGSLKMLWPPSYQEGSWPISQRWQSRKMKEFWQFPELLESAILETTNLKISCYLE